MQRLLELIKNTETVTFEVNGIGQESHKTIEFKSEIDEIERLVAIGRQIESMLKLPYPQILLTYGKASQCPKELDFYNVEDILAWDENDTKINKKDQ